MNVLFITADQWRGDSLSLAGHPAVATPSLDALAAEGVAFLNHHTQATPCGPSRACLHTGLYAFNHRAVCNGSPLDARHTTLALEARKAGYVPWLFGYTDTSVDPRTVAADDPRLLTYEGIAPGYEPVLPLLEAADPWLDHLAARGYGRLTLDEIYRRPLGSPAPFRAEDSETAFLADAFLAHLEGQPGDRPWFAHLSFIKPHPPILAADPYNTVVDAASVSPPLRAASMSDERNLHPWLGMQLSRPIGAGWFGEPLADAAALTDERIAQLRRVYLGLIQEVDHHVGRIVAALRQRGDLDDTLVIFTSDHGEMLGDHWLLGKSGFFRAAFHVPLIVRDPRNVTSRGRRVTAFTEHVDILPTVLEWLGLPVPLQADGHGLTPWLQGATPCGWRTATHWEHDFRDAEGGFGAPSLGLGRDECGIAVRFDGAHAYVHFTGLDALCFDHAADPGWTVDLAHEPGKAPVVAAMAQGMMNWRMRYADRRLTSSLLTPAGVMGAYE